MPKPGGRLCPICHGATDAAYCCGVRLGRPFRMSRDRISALRRYVHGRKGLDQETYRMHLSAVGATSTSLLTRTQHDALLERLRALPDMPRRATPADQAVQP